MTLPKAILETTFPVAGMTIRCYVLDDGERVINADDFEALMKLLFDGEAEIDPVECLALLRWSQGSNH